MKNEPNILLTRTIRVHANCLLANITFDFSGCRIASWDSRTLRRVAKDGLFHRAPQKDIWRVSKPWNHDTFGCKSIKSHCSFTIYQDLCHGSFWSFSILFLLSVFLWFHSVERQWLSGSHMDSHANPVMPFRHLRRNSWGDGNALHCSTPTLVRQSNKSIVYNWEAGARACCQKIACWSKHVTTIWQWKTGG